MQDGGVVAIDWLGR